MLIQHKHQFDYFLPLIFQFVFGHHLTSYLYCLVFESPGMIQGVLEPSLWCYWNLQADTDKGDKGTMNK